MARGQAGQPRVWAKAGELGLILPDIPEDCGGGGGTPAHAAVAFYELGYSGNSGLGLGLNHIVGHYLLRYGSQAQKRAWLPGLASGAVVGAIAMTEPGTGSDLQSVRTRAERRGSGYVINGSKTFMPSGPPCDMVVAVAKTDPSQGGGGTALLIVDAATPGFRRAKALDTIPPAPILASTR